MHQYNVAGVNWGTLHRTGWVLTNYTTLHRAGYRRGITSYRKLRNLIKQSDYDNAVTKWQSNPEASD